MGRIVIWEDYNDSLFNFIFLTFNVQITAILFKALLSPFSHLEVILWGSRVGLSKLDLAVWGAIVDDWWRNGARGDLWLGPILRYV